MNPYFAAPLLAAGFVGGAFMAHNRYVPPPAPIQVHLPDAMLNGPTHKCIELPSGNHMCVFDTNKWELQAK